MACKVISIEPYNAMAEKRKTVGSASQIQDTNTILDAKLGPLRDDLQKALASTNTPWYKSPWLLTVSASLVTLLGAWAIAIWQGAQTHNASDLSRDIALEVSRQVDPIKGDIGRIKQQLAIAKNTLPPAQFIKDLPRIKKNLADARVQGKVPSLREIEDLRSNVLLASDRASEDYWTVVLYLVNFRSHYALANRTALQPGIVLRGAIDHASISDTTIRLDSKLKLTNSLFTNRVIMISERDPPSGIDARFINCEFLIEMSGPPQDKIKRLGEALLSASNSHDVTLRGV